LAEEFSAMKCESCGNELRFSATPPGTFLLIGIVAFIVAAVAGTLSLATSGGNAFLLVVAVTAAGASVFCASAAWTAMIDNRSMGSNGEALPGRQCAICNHVTPLRPWSR
jgi:hypothetical protein